MIGLMDCNNFFASCERLFRPDLQRVPVAVLSSNDGCIVARSQEVKDLGIPMGIPYFEVKDVCVKNNVVVFSSNFTLYRDISARVMTALKNEFETCEVYSVDEAFFEVDEDVTEETLAEIRARIMKKTGIPVSIGVATTKTLAKVANGIAKKGNGVCIMDEALWQTTQKILPCGSVWGIGRQTSAFLSRHNISLVSELLMQDRAFIKQAFGIVGERLILELQGVSVYGIGEYVEEGQKSYTSTRSFARVVKNKHTLMSALGHHVAHVAEKLRHDNNVASTMTILVRANRFNPFAYTKGHASVELLVPTNDTMFLTREASKLLDTIFDPAIPYKKAGVIMSGIRPVEFVSSPLFKEFDPFEKTRELNSIADILNDRFGSGTVCSGVTLGSDSWREKKNQKSKEYTTKWSEIALVKAR